jgi:Holliday junction DNA helicase RuvA
MYNHLTGKLIEKNPAYIIIECAGIGFFVNISLNTYSKIGDNEQIRILTHLQITEDAQALYGFYDEEERRLFRLLISVSGIGCNTARMMLSSMNVAEIESCIINDQVKKLQSIKGIGEKTAMRVILELKGKLKKEGTIHPPVQCQLRLKDEAMAALLTLGFARNAIDKTLDNLLKTNSSSNVEDLIKNALKAL